MTNDSFRLLGLHLNLELERLQMIRAEASQLKRQATGGEDDPRGEDEVVAHHSR